MGERAGAGAGGRRPASGPSADGEGRVADAPPACPNPRPGLSLELALDLVICGAALAGLSLLARYLQPDFPVPTLGAGLAGGALCVLWGVLGWWNVRGRGGAMATLVLLACVFLFQAARSWQAAAVADSKGRMVAALLVVVLTLCVGMLWTLAQADRRP